MSELGEKVRMSIERLRAFEPKNGEGYYLAFSGGKDSVVIKALADMAGVKYDAHYRVTSVDPPELVQFIKEKYPDVARDVPRYSDGSPITMWNLIPRKLMPPTRLVRYCCASLKESGGDGRKTITGVRWAESVNRKANQGLVTIHSKKAAKELSENSFFFNKSGGWCLLMTMMTQDASLNRVTKGTKPLLIRSSIGRTQKYGSLSKRTTCHSADCMTVVLRGWGALDARWRGSLAGKPSLQSGQNTKRHI